MSKGKSKPSAKLEKLAKLLDAEDKFYEEYATSEESCLAEYVSDFGYGEQDCSFEYVSDELKASIEHQVKTNRDWRKDILQFCEVKLVGIHYEDNAIFSATIGEQEHQLDDELTEKLNRLTKPEFEKLKKLTSAAFCGKHRDLIYTSHDYDRFVLVVDEEKYLEAFPAPKVIPKIDLSMYPNVLLFRKAD